MCIKQSTRAVLVPAWAYAISPPRTRISYPPARASPTVPLSIPAAAPDSELGIRSAFPTVRQIYSRQTTRPLLPYNVSPPWGSLGPYNTVWPLLASCVCSNRALRRVPNQNHRSTIGRLSLRVFWYCGGLLGELTLRTQLLFIRRFPGFMSLCNILAECKYFSPMIRKKEGFRCSCEYITLTKCFLSSFSRRQVSCIFNSTWQFKNLQLEH